MSARKRGPYRVAPLLERVERFAVPEPNTGCWLWIGAVDPHGYGVLSVRNKIRFAHRASWEAHRGIIPSGMVVMHKCDNPPCVNPAHLAVGTQDENMADMARKGRVRRGSRSKNHMGRDHGHGSDGV